MAVIYNLLRATIEAVLRWRLLFSAKWACERTPVRWRSSIQQGYFFLLRSPRQEKSGGFYLDKVEGASLPVEFLGHGGNGLWACSEQRRDDLSMI